MRCAAVSPPPPPPPEVSRARQTSQDLAPFRYLNQALADDPVGSGGRQVELAESRNPRMRAQHARQGVEDGRLAGAIGANEGHDLPLRDAKRNPTDRLNRAIRNLQIANVEQWRGRFGGDRGRGWRALPLF